jgi:pimeloyl-ACP methyl ester carboxylesterase
MPYARNGEVELYYETFGDPAASPLLLINGLGSQSINYDETWCGQFVDAGFFVIRFDNRDVGLSSKLDHDYSLDEMAADALAVLDELGIARAHVHGISLGGAIVQVLAINHPERLVSVTSVMARSGDPSVGASTDQALALLTATPPSERDAYVQHFLEQQRTWGSPAEFDEERLTAAALAAYDRSFYPEGRERQRRAAVSATNRTQALRQVRIPTLVIHGDQDKLVDVSAGRQIASLIPGSRYVEFKGMGHDYPPAYRDRWVHHVTVHARGAETG